jgi:hypothetical protein
LVFKTTSQKFLFIFNRSLKKVILASHLPLEQGLKVEQEVFQSLWGGPANLQALQKQKNKK